MIVALFAASASALEVCPATACVYGCVCSLSEALQSGEKDIVLAPGIHRVDMPLHIDHQVHISGPNSAISTVAGEQTGPPALAFGAVLKSTGLNSALLFEAGSEGSSLSDVQIGANLSEYFDLSIEADGVTIERISMQTITDVSPVEILDAHDVVLRDLLVEGVAWVSPEPVIFIRNASLSIERAGFFFAEVQRPLIQVVDSALEWKSSTLTAEQVAFFPFEYPEPFLSATGSDVSLENLAFSSSSEALPFESLVSASGGGALEISGLTLSLSGEAPLVLPFPAIEAEMLDELYIHDATFSSALRAVNAEDVGEVIVERVVFDDLLESDVSSLTLASVPKATITESWFCGSNARSGGGAISLLSSCDGEDGCAIERSVFFDAFSFDEGGAVWLDAGRLSVERSTLKDSLSKKQGQALFVGEEAEVVMYRTLLAQASISPAISGLGESSLSEVGAGSPVVTGGLDQEDVLENVYPVWHSNADNACLSSVMLADDRSNDWFAEHRVGRFVPCWEDFDGDGFGDTQIPDGPDNCEDAGYVSVGGDCSPRDPSVGGGLCDPDHIDEDGDGIFSQDDCDDTNPKIAQCSLRWVGGCDAAGRTADPTLAVCLSLLLLCRGASACRRRADRVRARGDGGIRASASPHG